MKTRPRSCRGFVSLSLALWVGLAGVALAPRPAAQRQVKVNRPDIGLKLRLFQFLSETTLPPMERQILAKWLGKSEVTVEIASFQRKRKEKRTVDLLLFAFTIDKTAERRVGPSEAARLNGAIDLDDFLVRRNVIDPEDPRLYDVKYDRPLRNKSKGEYKVVQVVRKSRIRARIYSVETDEEIFGLVATSKDTLQPYTDGLDTIAKSIQRVEVVAKTAASEDPYEGSQLPHVERRRKVVASLPPGWQHRDSENFLVITGIKQSRKNDKLLDAISNDLELMRTEYAKRFPPVRPIEDLAVVRIFADYDDYMAYGAPKGTGGYWSPRHKELVLPNPGQRVKNPLAYRKGQNPMHTLYHEAMHQYLNYANGVVPPASWFNEGYGDYFGGAVVDRRKNTVKKIGYNQTRFKMVKLQAKNDAFPPLKNMLRMTQDEFYGKFALKNYAFSWSFCYFLEHERQKSKKQRNAEWAAIPEQYLKNLREATRTAGGDPYRKAYEKTFGTLDLNALQDAWIKCVKSWR